ncbi:hypothetical protein SBX64_07685 [Vibrio rhizosphaerae]|uniref:Uncharacterized protein n=1 Tax=Vibrio rhizosphaerae TaxID=398736 RepID=A0ABU4ISR5_9VIBR|nr:hypothetical protein [Vibrio rhizosphaerae]MDW6092424.1 hypothetical protein [Vibrio rhizosphaerae]
MAHRIKEASGKKYRCKWFYPRYRGKCDGIQGIGGSDILLRCLSSLFYQQSSGSHGETYKKNRETYASGMGDKFAEDFAFSYENAGLGKFGGAISPSGILFSDTTVKNTQAFSLLRQDHEVDYRALTTDEVKAIEKLAAGDSDRAHRLKAAGCVLVHCSAGYSEGSSEYQYFKGLEDEGAAYQREQSELVGQTVTYYKASTTKVTYPVPVEATTAGLFRYDNVDKKADAEAAIIDKGKENTAQFYSSVTGLSKEWVKGITEVAAPMVGAGAAALTGKVAERTIARSQAAEGLPTSGKTLSREETSIISRGNSGGSVAGASSTESGPLLLEYKPGVADKSKLPVVIAETPSVNRGSLAGVGSSSSSPAVAIGEGTELAGSVATKGEQLLDGLVNSGVKITPENVVDIRKLSDGKTVWLETGNDAAGLQHIYRHANEFAGKGIPKEQIPDAIFTALEKGKIVGYQGKGTGRPIYEYQFNGQMHRAAITVGNNGFIVGANPQ